MGASISNSQPITAQSDLMPTLNDSTAANLITRSTNATASSLSESMYGDSLTGSNAYKSNSLYGDSLTNSSQNINLSGASSIVDGGAIMAMFNLASKAIDLNSPVSILESLNKERGGGTVGQAASEAVEDVASKIKDFVTENKTIFILGALVVGYLVYKGVSK